MASGSLLSPFVAMNALLHDVVLLNHTQASVCDLTARILTPCARIASHLTPFRVHICTVQVLMALHLGSARLRHLPLGTLNPAPHPFC